MNNKFFRNPWLCFLPFLFYYAYLIVRNKWHTLYGDELRYVQFAKNLIHGFYSPPAPGINLWNGPGFPIILAPFEALRIPDLYITLVNALYLYLAVVLLFKALNLVANFRIALFFSMLLAIYPNALAMLPILYTEAFTGFLVSSFIYAVTVCYTKAGVKYLWIAGLLLGYITLTKIIFGYVLLLCITICLFMLLLKNSRAYCIKTFYMLLIAMAVNVPYLGYTWHITGKVFYWGNAGGMSLYWMSTPYENEYGDWKLPSLSNNQYPTFYKSPEAVALLKKNHQKDLKYILGNNEIEQDARFKKIAIQNIQQYPMKFISNYCYNFSRMLFNFPYSYSWQDGAILRNLLIGSLILWSSVIAIIVTFLNWRKVIFPVKVLLLISSIYFLLSGALSSYPRQLDVMLPVLLFWIGYLLANIAKPSLQFENR